MYYEEENVCCCRSMTGIHGLLVSEIRIYGMVIHLTVTEIYSHKNRRQPVIAIELV